LKIIITLFIIPDLVKSRLIIDLRVEYYTLSGEHFIAEGNNIIALDYYRRAFGLAPNVKLSAKIRWLENSI